MSRVVTTGVAGSGAPNRLEIHDFVRDKRMFSLYVLALQRMQKMSQDDIISFFQVSGIHGLPYIPWDGSTGSTPFDPSAQWGGYCVHGSTLFPTWHRPYMMLYEQILSQFANEAAATYTVDTANWVQAAADLRQPYWDWAADTSLPQEVIALEKVTITTPDGQDTLVENPLVRYRFHPIEQSFPSPYSEWRTTLRQPTNNSSSAKDNVTRLRNILQNIQSDIRNKTFFMLTLVHTWPAFSNHTVDDGGSSSNSLEGIHDQIHVVVGGSGHMSNPAVAAFDPIFFLHHANVDRLLSLWAALNPDLWVSSGNSQNGTFTMLPDITVDETTYLSPFYNGLESVWASTGVRDTTPLGYSYPEFNGLDMNDKDAVQAAILQIVNNLYGGSAAITSLGVQPEEAKASHALKPTTAATPAPRERALFTEIHKAKDVLTNKANVLSAKSAPTHVVEDLPAMPRTASAIPDASDAQAPVVIDVESASSADGLWNWTARVEFKKYELGGSFSVPLFLGTVPDDSHRWLTTPHYVGAVHGFVNSAAVHCKNCRNQGDVVVEGFIHLNDEILKHSAIQSLKPEYVGPYLKENLHYRVIKTDGTPAVLKSLKVFAIGREMSLPPGAVFPVQGKPHHVSLPNHASP